MLRMPSENRIIVSDEGTGMSNQDLIDNYLVIGTASRKRAIDACDRWSMYPARMARHSSERRESAGSPRCDWVTD